MLLRFLWKKVYLTRRSMEPSVQSEDIIDFVSLIKGNHAGKRFFMERSENVQIRVAQHFLLILRECGAAKGKRNKKFVTPPVSTQASRYAGYLAKTECPSSHEILDHWALRWWGGNAAKADEILNSAQMNAGFHR